MTRMSLYRFVTLLLLSINCGFSASALATGSHAIAMHGTPKYDENFQHFDYVNPQAPKGGTLRLATVSTSGFDSLNPFIIKGVPAAGITYLRQSYLYDSLAVHAADEPFTLYGLIAERMEVPPDRSAITFHLNPRARFQDGQPITAADVAYTFELLTKKGHPLFSNYYKDVAAVEILDPQRIKFSFSTNKNRELPLILAEMPVLPKHYWEDRDFSKTSLDIPLGSGPYRIAEVDPGRSISYQRNPDYWAKALPVNRGRYNFDLIKIDYYRDDNVALQALKSGEYDFRIENSAKNWATAYNGPPFDRNELVTAEIPNHQPAGMQGFAYNTRRPLFTDPQVRRALAYAFDFEWTNQNIFYGAYYRTKSYFDNSELAARGLPDNDEFEILNPFRKQLPEEVFSKVYTPPSTSGGSSIRHNLRTAARLLKEAGWEVRDNVLTHAKSGEPFSFEILLAQPSMERVVLPFKKNLSRLGINMRIRMVDTQQYINRINTFDFDMIVYSIGQSNSPGNEQRDYWHSSEAERPGSRNLMGIKDPVVDQLIELVIGANDRKSLITRVRALDRVLLWGHYVIPQFHNRVFRVAYWNHFGRPENPPLYSIGLDTWWHKH